jgi:hypothetical protein
MTRPGRGPSVRARVAAAERREYPYHEVRVLLLVAAFRERRARLDGLTKLAKLDFLLRYPTLAERLLLPWGGWPDELGPSQSERSAVESRMVRHKYGPWDDKYYPIVGALVGRGLARVESPSPLALTLTDLGESTVAEVVTTDEWLQTWERARFLARALDVTGSELKRMIYEGLPDVVDRPHRTEI